MRLGDPARRLRGFVVLLALVVSLFGARLVQIQGLDAPVYAAKAADGRLRDVVLPAQRGTITDRNGVVLATTVDAVDVTTDQTKVVDPAATASVLAPVLGQDPATVTANLTGSARFKVLAKAVTPAIWRRVQSLDHPDPKVDGLPGIYSQHASKRVYPGGSLAANLVGYVGSDGQGLGGLEYALNSVLSGRDGAARYELSAGGRRIPSGIDTRRNPVPGTDVRLTIDHDIQYVAQQAIAKAARSSGAQSGTVIVYQPGTGDLLAVATAPTFDANKPGTAEAADRGDRPLNEAYEPGSTGKLITAAALLQEGAISPSTPIVVPNRLTRAGKSFKDWEDHGTEYLTYAGTIAKSSNIGTIKAAERLGDLRRLYPYFQKFGIGQPTGLGLPGEQKGEMLRPADWSATTGYTMAFGQGYSVNTVQMASVVATIANDGVRVAPRLVAGTTGPDGKAKAAKASPTTRVVSAKTASTVRMLMEGVTGEGGTAPLARIPGYRVGGKTGTAQRYDPVKGRYSGFTLSFIGLAPADRPGVVVAVTLQAPKVAIGGGFQGGPVFKEVASFALETLRVPPTGTPAPKLRLTTR